MKMPLNIGLIHFIGIGGIGMSGIAELLHNLGYQVQGSDQAENGNTKRLQAKGIKIFIGHQAANLGAAEVVVISSAVKPDNVEYKAARAKYLPIVRRAEMLAELMRFRQAVAIGGTHGKTTTTSLVSVLLEAGGLDPTVINGGIINARGTNAYLGSGDFMVVEADESDGSFLKLPADIVVITNIDPEHLDYYGSYDKICQAFYQFVENVPFYGFGVLCIDHPQVRALAGSITDRRIITYGADSRADVRFTNMRREGAKSVFDVIIRSRKNDKENVIKNIALPMPGVHNISNATAEIAVAHELGVKAEAIKKGLLSFGGVKRRFTHTGSWQGVEFFDDYGHHPVEIKAVLRAAREVAGEHKVIAIMQPHRYSRLANLFDDFAACFDEADYVAIAPVYAAGEEPIKGVDNQHLVEKMRQAGLVSGGLPDKQQSGQSKVRALSGIGAAAPFIREVAKSGDCVVFLGAGNITQWAEAVPKELNGEGAAVKNMQAARRKN